jgi:hypothetical protein
LGDFGKPPNPKRGQAAFRSISERGLSLTEGRGINHPIEKLTI